MDAAMFACERRKRRLFLKFRDKSVPAVSYCVSQAEMKHPSTRDFFAYWDQKRGSSVAPERGELDPGEIRHLLGDTFVLSCDHDAGFPLRVSGTRLSALLGRDLKGESFIALWSQGSRQGVADLIDIASEEHIGAVAGVTAHVDDGSPVHLELLLLPFSRHPHTPINLTGTLVPLTVSVRPCGTALGALSLTTWRHVGHRPQTIRQRALRRWSAARGLMVYEGLRGRS
jgi:hypothetical protein